MVFSSFTFLLLFLPAVVLLYWRMPGRIRMPFLLMASLLFYAWGNPVWLLLLLYCMVLTWLGAKVMCRVKHRKAVLALLIILDLLPLLWFKYADFFRNTLEQLTGLRIAFDTPLLPAGISFFTFQALSYLLDVYRGDAEASPGLTVFGVYLSLFPQLVAGPIVRYTELEAQLRARPAPQAAEMRAGLRRFIIGLAKKVLLADAMGRFWGQMNGDFSAAGWVGAWAGLLAFSFQIFFDFSGYSDMAIGIGHMLGFTLPENFDRPYRAGSLTGFWRRWHMSLTGWFKTYVYIPLGGSRKGRLRRDLNVFIVWALTGLWHGAGWHFVLWGLYFAVLLVLEKRFMPAEGRPGKKGPGPLRQAITFLLVMLGWGIFSGFGTELAGAMLGAHGAGSATALTACAAFSPMLLLCCAVSFLPSPRREKIPAGLDRALPALRTLGCAALLALCVAALAAQGYAPFVYFQF